MLYVGWRHVLAWSRPVRQRFAFRFLFRNYSDRGFEFEFVMLEFALFEFAGAIVFDGIGVPGRDVLSGPEFEVDSSALLQPIEKTAVNATAQQSVTIFIERSLHPVYVAVVRVRI
ncbi:MAG TPA: hypothetical protein VMZ26_17565 [Pyrinomonadaceae bacterium]|nr:hypothetical protein [Pyrinomonadaceae bacterium]